jgi:hypothetical protein
MDAVTLFRPVGAAELDLIRDSGWRAFPPRLPEQPIFYPVLDEEYAVQIARDWNTRDGGTGFVLRFQILRDYLTHYEIQTVGSRIHREYWIPAENLPEFNKSIVGTIQVVHRFENQASRPVSHQAVVLEGKDAIDFANAHLRKIGSNPQTWETEFVDPTTDETWIMEYPQSEEHGGGSPRLRKMFHVAIPDEIKMLPPWAALAWDRAKILERELTSELPPAHVLAGRKFRALAARVDRDDVLFEIEGNSTTLAVVHLTHQRESNSNWPVTNLFNSWELWVREVLIPDHNEFTLGE